MAGQHTRFNRTDLTKSANPNSFQIAQDWFFGSSSGGSDGVASASGTSIVIAVGKSFASFIGSSSGTSTVLLTSQHPFGWDFSTVGLSVGFTIDPSDPKRGTS